MHNVPHRCQTQAKKITTTGKTYPSTSVGFMQTANLIAAATPLHNASPVFWRRFSPFPDRCLGTVTFQTGRVVDGPFSVGKLTRMDCEGLALSSVAGGTGCRQSLAPHGANTRLFSGRKFWPGVPTLKVNPPRLWSRAPDQSGNPSRDEPRELWGMSAERLSDIELELDEIS